MTPSCQSTTASMTARMAVTMRFLKSLRASIMATSTNTIVIALPIRPIGNIRAGSYL